MLTGRETTALSVRDSLPTTQSYRKRIAVISAAVPPFGSGQATVLGHLLSETVGVDVILLSDFSFYLQATANEDNSLAGMDLRRLSKLDWKIPSNFRAPCTDLTAMLFALSRRAAEISETIKSDQVSAIIGCSGTPIDVPAASLAAQNLGVPFVAYLFDDPVYQWPVGSHRDFAAWQELMWSSRAAAVIAPNEFMADEFNRRTGRWPHIVRNPVNTKAYLNLKLRHCPGVIKRIVYTGSIYHAQLDAFRNLVDAISTTGHYELHIYTSQPKTVFDEHGIGHRVVVHHPYVDTQSIPQIQQDADILFLPLAFHTDIQEALRTSAPAKLGEYLAAGRPILVHAPPDSFVAHHVRDHNAAVVVDQPVPSALRAALDTVSSNLDAQRTLAENALKLSRDYDLERTKGRFWSLIEQVSMKSPRRWRSVIE